MDKRCVTRIPSIFDSDDDDEPPKDANLDREDTPTGGTSSSSPTSATSFAEKAIENSGNETPSKPEDEADASNDSVGNLGSDSKEEDSHDVKNIVDDKSASNYDENDEDVLAHDNNSSEENTNLLEDVEDMEMKECSPEKNTDILAGDAEDIEMKECAPDNNLEDNDKPIVKNTCDREDIEMKDDIADDKDDDIIERNEDIEVERYKDQEVERDEDQEVERNGDQEVERDGDQEVERDEDQEGASEGEGNETDTDGEDNLELDSSLRDDVEGEDNLEDDVEGKDSLVDDAEPEESIQDDAEGDNLEESKDDVTNGEESSLDEDGEISDEDYSKKGENANDGLNEENDIENATKESEDTREAVRDSDDTIDNNDNCTSGENVADKREHIDNSAAEESDVEMDDDESSIAEGDNEKQGIENEGNDFKDEEESRGYVIDLHETDSEPGTVKPEEREDIMDTASSSPDLGLKIDEQDEAKPIELEKTVDTLSEKTEEKEKQVSLEPSKDSVEDGEKNKVEAFGSADNMEIDLKRIETPSSSETTEKNIQDALVPKRKKKLALIHIPVKVSDVYTDSEEETEESKEAKKSKNKDEDTISSTTASADPEEDQKDNSSLSSRQGSIEPDLQPLSSILLTQLSVSAVGPLETTSKSAASGNTVFKKKPRRSAVGVFDREKCLFAFEQGWRRELVHRATSDPTSSSRIRADVYYYTPTGKKLRSKVEIEDFLARKGITNLTIENFCFSKESIGGSETQEVIRHATKSQGGTPQRKVDAEEQQLSDEKLKWLKVMKSNPSTLLEQFKKRGRPRGNLKKPSPKRIKLTPASSAPNTEYKTTFRNIAPKATVKVPLSSVRPVSSVTGTIANTTQTSVPQSSGTQKNQTLQCRKPVPKNHVMYTTKLCEPEVLPPRILTPMLSKSSRQQAFHCTKLCPLAVGQVPSLQCMKCLCLFHAKCIKMPFPTLEIIQSGGAKFLCPNCYKEQKEKITTREFIPPKTYEPLAVDPPPSSESEDDDNDEAPDPSVYPLDYVRVNLYNSAIPTPPTSPAGVKGENSDDQTDEGYIERIQVVINSNAYKGPVSKASTATSNSEGHSTSVNPNMMPPEGSKPAAQGSGNNVVGLPGSQIFKIQAAGVNVPRYILVKPTQSSVTLPTSSSVQPAGPIYIPSVGGPFPYIFPNAAPMASRPQLPCYGASSQIQLMNSGSTQFPQIYNSSGFPFPHQTVIPSTGFPSSAVQSNEENPQIQHSKIPVAVVKKDFLQDLSQSYKLLLHVFRYLTAKDLLITSQVCLMWRDLSYSPSLWSTVRLRNICVKDWKQLALFLERRNTTAIDLRKMVFRVQQSSFDSEEPSRLDSSVPPSPASSNSKDLPSSSTAENISEKGPSSSEKCINDESERKVTDVNDVQTKESNESPSRDNSLILSDVIDTQDASKSIITETSEVSHSASRENVGEKENNNKLEDFTSDNTRKEDKVNDTLDVSGIKKDIEGQDSKPLSESEDEPMEIDEDLPNVGSELPMESNSKEQVEKNLNVAKENKFAEKVKKDEQQDAKSLSDDHIYTSQEKVKGYMSKQLKSSAAEEYSDGQSNVNATWSHICEALGTVRCLRSVVLPACRPIVLQLLLSNCKNLTSVTAAEVATLFDSKFDPAYLMEVPFLKELRICSTKGFAFATNFNFIKLPELKVLVIRGLMGNTWPYLGTNLTSLHLGPCRTFTQQTWKNIGSMTKLKALWLEDGNSGNDANIFEAISHLTQLRRLCLFNFTVGAKLGSALRKLHKLERLFVLQNSSDEMNMGIKNHNMLAVTENLRNLLNLVWAISSQDIKVINGVDHMKIFSPNLKSYPILSSKDNTTDQWPVKLIETVVSRHLAATDVRILKLDPAAASRMALSTL